MLLYQENLKYSAINEINVRKRYLDDISVHQLYDNFGPQISKDNHSKKSIDKNLLLNYNSKDYFNNDMENLGYGDYENTTRQNSIRFTSDLPIFDHGVVFFT